MLASCLSVLVPQSSDPAPPQPQLNLWTGFTRITAFGSGCTAALADDPATAMGPLTFIPCTSGEAQCEELRWDGAVHWDPGGSGDMLVFDVQFVHDATGRATRVLVRHHYPIGDGYGPDPYEAVLYDLSSGVPLAVLRNNGTQASTDGIESGGGDCLAIPVASPHGLWLIGGQDRSAAMVAAYLDEPGSVSPAFHPLQVDASFLTNAAIAFDDRLAVSQDDGKIVVADTQGGDNGVYGPGERVWLWSTIGDRFVVVNDKASDGDHYYTLDSSMAFARYGGTDPIATDGVHIVSRKTTAGGIEAWTADAADGTTNATMLASVPSVTSAFDSLTYFGDALDQGTYALLTDVQGDGSDSTGPVTATVVPVSGGTAATGTAFADAENDSLLPGYRQLVGFAGGYLWFAEVGDLSGFSKIIRMKAPSP
jgi:hypothetical protein